MVPGAVAETTSDWLRLKRVSAAGVVAARHLVTEGYRRPDFRRSRRGDYIAVQVEAGIQRIAVTRLRGGVRSWQGISKGSVAAGVDTCLYDWIFVSQSCFIKVRCVTISSRSH